MNKRNRIKLYTRLDDRLISHFSMHEFENAEGLVMIHPTVLRGLECVRQYLNTLHSGGIVILVRDATRTETENRALAAKHGWIDEEGKVSRESRHLAKWGGIAVDIVAEDTIEKERVLQDELGASCRVYFDWVKDDYLDGHVHADQRDGGRKLERG